ncbi:MAG: FecR family protein [Candidatus Omnitrophota bacterium]|jgi:hypothetical protein
MKRNLKVAGIGAILFLILAGAANAQTPRKGIVDEPKGQVEIRTAGGQWQAAQQGSILNEGDEIRAAEQSSAIILLDDAGATGKLELREKSRLRMTTMGLDAVSGDQQTLLELATGKVLIHAEKLKGESRFEVKTPNAITGVRGTVFEVSVED